MYLEDNTLKTSLFIKPTSSLAYLQRTSCHPIHVFLSLPYGEFLRTRRNSTDNSSYDHSAKIILDAFVDRGYDAATLTQAMLKARETPRSYFLDRYTTGQGNQQSSPPADFPRQFYLVLQYHARTRQVRDIIRSNWGLLSTSYTTKWIHDSKLIMGYRRNPNLKDLLVMPQPLGAGGIMFSGCPSVRPSEAWNTLFWPVHRSVGPPDQPLPFYGMSVRPSVRPSVHPSVTPFWLCSHHRIIMKFSGVITNGRSDVHANGGGQRSKVKVTEVTTQLNRFRTVTPVWIHIWWWNDAYSLIMLREVPYCFSRSFVKFQGHTALKIVEFDPDWAFPDCNSSLNSHMMMKWYT